MITEDKKEQVEKLIEVADASDAVVMSDYSGLTVSEVNELRGKLAELGADLKVVKNTLLGIALEKAGLKNGGLSGPTAVLFSQNADPLESIKTLVSFLKEKGKGEVKFGFFEKAFVEASRIKELAAIPGMDVLQAQLVSHLSSPLYRFANVLSGGPQRLAGVLNQIAKLGGGESS
jgi:large subunit ribosomal protein L10